VSDDTAQTINVTGTGIDSTLLEGDVGQYFARVRFNGARPPSTITVSNVSDNPNSIKEVVPVDFITATANYNTDTQELTIVASSSDSLGAPVLSISDFGLGDIVIPVTGISTTNLTFAPSQVTITSAAGGERTIPVTVTGNPNGPIPATANAGVDQTVIINSTVSLNGSNSTGVITSFNWLQLAGTSITLIDANTATPSFVASNLPTTLVFELTVDGEGGPSTDTVNVEVIESVPAPIANAGPNQTVQQGTSVTLAGSATGNVTSYQWAQTAGVPVQLTNANTATATFIFPTQSTTLTFQLTVQGPGGTSSDIIQIASVPENLTITRAEFRTGDAEWRISGTSDVSGAGVTISIFNGSTLSDPLLAQVPVDVLGEWEYRVEGSTTLPGVTRAISIQSSSGGTLINVPITIRG
jgi:hypothetical protein